MVFRLLLALAVPGTVLPATANAQSHRPDLSGTWKVETPDGPQNLVVRPDSSASFGDEIVRWRVRADTMYIAFGEEWVGYNYVMRGDTLTFSGGDLEEPIDLVRVGPATPRPKGVQLPDAPTLKTKTGG